jgi:amidohydrolase family protein
MKKLLLPLFFVALPLASSFAQGPLAIVNVTVIDGTDHPPRANTTVLVEDGKIRAITNAGRNMPADVTRIDGTGKFLISGLWNNDLHSVSYGAAKQHLGDLLSYGVTTVRDMGSPLDDIIRLRSEIASGALTGPHLFIAGPLMEGPIPVKMPLVVDLFSAEEARAEVTNLKKHSVNYIEVDTSLNSDLYWALANAGRHVALPLVGHIPPTIRAWDVVKARQVDIEHLGGRYLNVLIACSKDEAYFDGVMQKTYDELLAAVKAHEQTEEPQFKADFDEKLLSSFDKSKAERLYRLYARNGIAQTPTLYVLKTLWETNRDNQKLDDRDMEAGKRIFAKDLAVVGAMRRAGVPILAGTDGPYGQGGNALHGELELLVQAGLTPLQALQSASRDAAKAMGVSREVGTIEVGKTADLVLLDANPLTNISNTRRIEAVVLRGQLLPKEVPADHSH